MLLLPTSGFNWRVSNPADGTEPDSGTWGASITPGNNTYGSYTEVLTSANMAYDAWEVDIWFSENDVSAAARDTIVTIGVDPAGGTSYQPWAEHLLASCAYNNINQGFGIFYKFPVLIPAGSSVAAKASVNNATVGTLRCAIQVAGRPDFPERHQRGTFIDTYGAVTATSKGTDVTASDTTDGAWTSLATSITRPVWAFEWGFGSNNSAMGNASILGDVGVGDASNKRLVLMNGLARHLNTESIVKPAYLSLGRAAVGDNIYGRLQGGPGTLDSTYSMCAYGIGGSAS